jgi:hypothetical protein
MEETKKPEAAAPEEPKVLYKYTVSYLSNGFYQFDGVELEAGKGPSIDQQHIMYDVSNLGHKVDHDLAVNDAVRQIIQLMQNASKEQAPAEPTPDKK